MKYSLAVVALIGVVLAGEVAAGSLFDFLSCDRSNKCKPAGLNLDQVRDELNKSRHLTGDQMENLFDKATGLKGELYYGNTVRDYKMLMYKDTALCNMAELKRRVLMHHGRDESRDKLPITNIRINLTRFCRRQFYLMIDNCLYWSEDRTFLLRIGRLYKRDREWEARQHEDFVGPTPMEKFILRYQAESSRPEAQPKN